MIECQLCHKKFGIISPSHLKFKHNMGVAEYRRLYGDVMTSEKKKEVSKKIKENHWSKKPKEETKKIRKAISSNGSRVMKQINETGKAFRWTKKHAKEYWTDDRKDKHSSACTGKTVSNKTRQLIKENHWSKKSEKEFDEIIEKIFIKSGQMKNTARGWFYSKKAGERMYYMSSYELRRLRFLESCDEVVKFTTSHGIKGFIRDPEKVDAKKRAAIGFCNNKNWTYVMIFENNLEVSHY